MALLSINYQQNTRTYIVAAIVLAIIATCLIFHPFGWLGYTLWPLSPLCPLPSDAQFPFFAFIALVEASAFGLGIAWLIEGWIHVRRSFPRTWQRIVIYVGIAWHLLNWYPHDSLHMNVGVDLRYMLLLELVFHVTLIAVTVAMAAAVAVKAIDG